MSKQGSDFILSQHKYLLDLLQKTHMEACNSCESPMAVHTKLSRFKGEIFENTLLYRSIVGALQYLRLTRPDIAFCVNKLNQFLQSPTVAHWNACKRLLRFLNGTDSSVLCFTASSSNCLEVFADADWASCPDDRRFTGGHCVFFRSNLVVWISKKQEVVSRSSSESEYRSLAKLHLISSGSIPCVLSWELMWLHLIEFGLTILVQLF